MLIELVSCTSCLKNLLFVQTCPPLHAKAKPGDSIDFVSAGDAGMNDSPRKSSFKAAAQGPAKVARTDGKAVESRAAGSAERAGETNLDGGGGSASVFVPEVGVGLLPNLCSDLPQGSRLSAISGFLPPTLARVTVLSEPSYNHSLAILKS